MKQSVFFIIILVLLAVYSCHKDANDRNHSQSDSGTYYTLGQFCMGADLSYVNQIEDHGGEYLDSGQVRDPFRIFKDHGANLVRLRLWHNPVWTKTVYQPEGAKIYSDLADVEKSIRRAKDLGMAVDLDFHYSDTWADPSKQKPPDAWASIKNFSILKDSLYQYTYNTLSYLNSRNLMPEMVQIGNEINCGLFYTETDSGFPTASCCDGNWERLGELLNAGIKAVRDVSEQASVHTEIALHVADPKNVTWWFEHIINNGKVTDFDIVGFSYYPLWHTTISFGNIDLAIKSFKSEFNRKVMILETAYPWTTENVDSYTNLFGSQTPISGYPYTIEGQSGFLISLVQKVVSGGGNGVIYWEPAWISSSMKDPWGTGSCWENCTFFNFDKNTLPSIDYMNHTYTFPSSK